MNNHLSMIREQMEVTMQVYDLPEFYKDDLIVDVGTLKRFEGLSFVWLFLTKGTLLVPVGIGFNPASVMYWLKDSFEPEPQCFSINTSADAKATLREIDSEETSFLINLPPSDLYVNDNDLDVHISTVNHVLERGSGYRIWGKETPKISNSTRNWDDWKRFFASSNNKLMQNYMNWASQACLISLSNSDNK